jgi:predicted S18 family serine protease
VAHRTLAAVLIVLDPAEFNRARNTFLAAIQLHQDSNNQPELARSYIDYASFLQRQRHSNEAMTYLTRGIDRLRYMGMAWDLNRAERLLTVGKEV